MYVDAAADAEAEAATLLQKSGFKMKLNLKVAFFKSGLSSCLNQQQCYEIHAQQCYSTAVRQRKLILVY